MSSVEGRGSTDAGTLIRRFALAVIRQDEIAASDSVLRLVCPSYPCVSETSMETFVQFLRRVERDGDLVRPGAARAAKLLWYRLLRSVPHLEEPRVGRGEGGGLQLVWDNRPDSVTIDVLPDGSCEWLHVDSDRADREEDPWWSGEDSMDPKRLVHEVLPFLVLAATQKDPHEVASK